MYDQTKAADKTFEKMQNSKPKQECEDYMNKTKTEALEDSEKGNDSDLLDTEGKQLYLQIKEPLHNGNVYSLSRSCK